MPGVHHAPTSTRCRTSVKGSAWSRAAVSCPERSPMAVAESLLSAAHTVQEIVPAEVLVSQQARKWRQRLRIVASQQLCQGREAEVARTGFGEQAKARQIPQQPKQGLRVGPTALGKCGPVTLPVRQGIRQVPCSRPMHHWRDSGAAGQCQQLVGPGQGRKRGRHCDSRIQRTQPMRWQARRATTRLRTEASREQNCVSTS
jgi:hypothetical protein